jgi:hypothetical protein
MVYTAEPDTEAARRLELAVVLGSQSLTEGTDTSHTKGVAQPD